MKIELTEAEQILLSDLLWREHIKIFNDESLNTEKELKLYQNMLVELGEKIRGIYEQ